MNKSAIVCMLLLYSSIVISQSDKYLALKTHNEARAELGIPPLKYSNRLAKDAENYAKKLARLDQGLIHSERNEDGENLFMSFSSIGQTVNFSNQPFVDASLSWFSEKKKYTYSKIGDEPNFAAIGHYTQMIWKTTTLVGFGYARSKAGNEYVVARYAKAENIIGYFPY